MLTFPYHWHVLEEYGATKIRIFGLSQSNESVYVQVDDFLPYMYVELPTKGNDDRPINWTVPSFTIVQNKLKELSFHSLVHIEPVYKRKLYYVKKDIATFADKTYPFLKCYFKASTNLRNLAYKLRNPIFMGGVGKIQLKTHETDANPILQFMCMMNIKPASWFTFRGRRVDKEDEKESLCAHEYLVGFRSVAPVDQTNLAPARPYILSFDIEVNSTNPNVAPRCAEPGDKIFQISCIFGRNGCAEDTFEKYILTLCKSKQGELIDLNMEKLGPGIEVLGYETEGDLMEGFRDLILEKNPQIICGYNIFSFDLVYMHERSKMCNNERQFSQLSCIRGVPCKIKEIKWSSSAFKNQEFKYFDAHGRLWVDLLPIVQRDYKLENYKLKTVSDHFLGVTKDPLTVKGIFKCYRMFTPDSLAIVAKYCVVDSLLVLKLFEKLQMWIGLCEMSNTCNTPIFTLFTQGQQIKIFSQVYKKCMEDGIVIDKDSFSAKESDRFTGAYVFPPVPGLYDMVVSFDFSSLYPSTIIAYNIDYSTLVLDEAIPDDKCHVIEWQEHVNCKCPGAEQKKTKDVICEKQRFRFLKEPAGIIPTLLKNLLDARKKTNAEMKKMNKELDERKDTDNQDYIDKKRMITVLDKRQLSYKVSANSVAPNTPIPCLDADGSFLYLTMEEIRDPSRPWIRDEEDNEVSTPRPGLRVWTEKGFTPIKFVIRHPIRTPLKRVLTHTGCVDVTDEHSLLDEHGKEVRTIDTKIGDKLLHATLPLPSDTPPWPIAPFTVEKTEHKDAFYLGAMFPETLDRVPNTILSSDMHTRRAFLMGYNAKSTHGEKHELKRMCLKDQIGAASLYYLLQTLAYHVTVEMKNETYMIVIHCCKTNVLDLDSTTIQSMSLTPGKPSDYIYDIETENHHFAAGVGDLIVHNSMYGALGTRVGYLPFLPGAMCTTAKGRQSIEKASKFLTENYGAKLIYGDSVSGDTPILVRYEDQTVDILRIDEIGEVWKAYEEFKSDDTESNRREKEQTLPFVSSGAFRLMNILEVWTGEEWSRVRRVIRHKTVKQMYRVLTHTGCVDVTEDHSLLDKQKNKIKPGELVVGSELYHSFPPKEDFLEVEIKDAIIEGKVHECRHCGEHKLTFEFDSTKICKACVFGRSGLSETEYTRNPAEHLYEYDDSAFVWGVFFEHGLCLDDHWSINIEDLCLLEKCKLILTKCEPLFTWKIVGNTLVPSETIPGTITFIVNKWRRLFYDRDGYKKVPYFILNASDRIKLAFLNGYKPSRGDGIMLDIKGKIGAHGLYTLLYSLGITTTIDTLEHLDGTALTITIESDRRCADGTALDAVKKIVTLPPTTINEFVYDIETESGRFLGGVGRIILKNTDSCYINFPEYQDVSKIKDLDSFCRSIEDEISSLFPKPMKFAYEEHVYWRYLILTKKRYMALQCDLDGTIESKITKRGVLLSRRDNSKYIRDTYASLIMKAFYKEDINVVLQQLYSNVINICVNHVTVKDLVVTKSIGDLKDYKIRPLHIDDKKCAKRLQELGIYDKDTKLDVLRNLLTAFCNKEDIDDQVVKHNLEYLVVKEYIKMSLPAQVQLAERMRSRGSRVDAGERLGYVITQSGDRLSEKMEDTDYYKEHASSLSIDYLYYIKLMINPVDEVLFSVYEQKDLFKKFYKTREQFKKVMTQLELLSRPKLTFKD